MKNLILKVIFIALLAPVFSACGIDGHNRAELQAPDTSNEEVWGNPKGKPRQLQNKYEDKPENAARVDSIRTKLYPR